MKNVLHMRKTDTGMQINQKHKNVYDLSNNLRMTIHGILC